MGYRWQTNTNEECLHFFQDGKRDFVLYASHAVNPREQPTDYESLDVAIPVAEFDPSKDRDRIKNLDGELARWIGIYELVQN